MIKNGTLGSDDDIAVVVGIVIMIPVAAGRPGIVPIIAVIIAVVVTAAIIIPVIEFGP
jgi:hypothetical protein